MDFVATTDFVTPYVIATGQPHRPTEIKKKKFRKGEIITGEIKTVKGKPSFVLYKGVMVIPFSCVKQVITKEISFSEASGNLKEVAKLNPQVQVSVKGNSNQKRSRIMDGVIFGGILGFGGVLLAEKQGWMSSTDNKNKLYGAILGAFIGGYYLYRKTT
jgi:hypothetical protein